MINMNTANETLKNDLKTIERIVIKVVIITDLGQRQKSA